MSSAAWNCDWERILDHPKYKSQGRKSHSKSQNYQAKILHKKDTHVYNNCYELRSRAIKNHDIPKKTAIALRLFKRLFEVQKFRWGQNMIKKLINFSYTLMLRVHKSIDAFYVTSRAKLQPLEFSYLTLGMQEEVESCKKEEANSDKIYSKSQRVKQKFGIKTTRLQ